VTPSSDQQHSISSLEPPDALDPDDKYWTLSENQLVIWRHDIDLSSHHWHWHSVYPAAGLEFKDENGKKTKQLRRHRQGELFFYMHRQLLARYDAERISLNMAPVKSFGGDSYRVPVTQGHDSHLACFAPRPAGLIMTEVFARGKLYTLTDMETWQDRLHTAIDTGIVVHPLPPFDPPDPLFPDPPLPLPEQTRLNLDLLGEIVEPNPASKYYSYYGHLHGYAHTIISRLHDPLAELQSVVGPMGSDPGSTHDPVFWEWHKHVDGFAARWEARLKAADLEELNKNAPVAGVTVKSISLIRSKGINKEGKLEWEKTTTTELLTHLEYYEVTLTTNSILLGWQIRKPVEVGQEGAELESTRVVPAVGYVPFQYQMDVANNTAADVPVWVRIFLVPAAHVDDYRKWCEMDKFQTVLPAGTTSPIRRNSCKSSILQKLTKDDFIRPDDDDFFPKPDPNSPVHPEWHCRCGLPANLLLPRGKLGPGMKFVLTVVITKDTDPTCCSCPINSYCGSADPEQEYPDKLPLGYPFHQPFPAPSRKRPWLKADGPPLESLYRVTK